MLRKTTWTLDGIHNFNLLYVTCCPEEQVVVALAWRIISIGSFAAASTGHDRVASQLVDSDEL